MFFHTPHMYYRNLQDGALHCNDSILGGNTALCVHWFQYHRVNYPWKHKYPPQTLLSTINLSCWVISRTHILKKSSNIIILLSPSSLDLFCLRPLSTASSVLFATFFDDDKLKARMTWYFRMPHIYFLKTSLFFTSKKIWFSSTQAAKQEHKHV